MVWIKDILESLTTLGLVSAVLIKDALKSRREIYASVPRMVAISEGSVLTREEVHLDLIV